MAFKAVTDLSADTTISLGGFNKKLKKDNPTSVEGYYLGKKEVADQKKKSGKSFIYILQTPKGNLGVWGKTDMDRKMTQVATGNMIRITHVGMTPTPNGEMYKYSVEQDDSNTIEVATADTQDNSGADDYSAGGDETSYVSEESLDDEDASQEVALAKAKLDAAARKAKVEALLKNKRA